MKVSIIIPTYNSEKTISRALDSCVNQVANVLEVIVVDNGSNDNTKELTRSFLTRLPLVMLDEHRRGASIARNTGLKIARGEVIQFLDADDEILPEKIMHQMTLLKEEKLAFVASAYRILEHGNFFDHRINSEGSAWLMLFQGHLGITSSNLWLKESLLAVGGWDESHKSSQEADLMFRLLKSGAAVIFDNVPLTIIHQDAERRISTTNLLQNAIRFYELRLQMFEWLTSNEREQHLDDAQKYAVSLVYALNAIAIHNRSRAREWLKKMPAIIWSQLPITNRLVLVIKSFLWRYI